jgi:hypothetical protein
MYYRQMYNRIKNAILDSIFLCQWQLRPSGKCPLVNQQRNVANCLLCTFLPNRLQTDDPSLGIGPVYLHRPRSPHNER